MDILFLQIHLINQDYLQRMKEYGPSNSSDNYPPIQDIQSDLKEKYGLSNETMQDILSFLLSKQQQGKREDT